MARRSSPSRGSALGRGRSSPSPVRRAAPPPPPPKAVAPAPAQPTAVGQPAMAAPGGGMMANIASTAAGVAIGHTVGHAITGALGMNGGHSQPEPVDAQPGAEQPMAYQQHQPLAGQEPCKFELEQFLACAQNQSNDLTLCDGFNQVLRECKMRYGNMYQ
uniref:Coiled-coil-helix-coiled-coil-helix domain-containing protein 2, mitochondrial n=1 Tax=Aceria tosichella TaxID=561515 RepID=A0A6G1S4V8_9ACAR